MGDRVIKTNTSPHRSEDNDDEHNYYIRKEAGITTRSNEILWETTAYQYTKAEVEDLYIQNIKVYHIVAGQPRNRGGSKCTLQCDIENHHIHWYCKGCQRNLPYKTILHDCKYGFGLGKYHPDQKPEYLINDPWWKEPEAVTISNIKTRMSVDALLCH